MPVLIVRAYRAIAMTSYKYVISTSGHFGAQRKMSECVAIAVPGIYIVVYVCGEAFAP